jgi:hypothetical protein
VVHGELFHIIPGTPRPENKKPPPRQGAKAKTPRYHPHSSGVPSHLLADTFSGFVVNGSTYLRYASPSPSRLPWSKPKFVPEQSGPRLTRYVGLTSPPTNMGVSIFRTGLMPPGGKAASPFREEAPRRVHPSFIPIRTDHRLSGKKVRDYYSSSQPLHVLADNKEFSGSLSRFFTLFYS